MTVIGPRGQSLQAAFDSRDLDRLVELLDERVVWRGIPTDAADDDGQPPASADEQDDDHHHLPLCTDRDQVRGVFEGFLGSGGTGNPVVVAESGDSVVVDPQPQPSLAFPLHQGFTFRGDRIVLIQDYPDRDSALADLATS